MDAQADALRLRRTPYASRQGDGDAYHLEGAWTPSRRLGDALRTMMVVFSVVCTHLKRWGKTSLVGRVENFVVIALDTLCV